MRIEPEDAVFREKPALIRRPRTLFCYICGKEYGINSLQIHLKSCIKKFEMEESFKPPHKRRPVPQPPKNYDDVAIKGLGRGNIEDALDQFNQEAFKNFNE